MLKGLFAFVLLLAIGGGAVFVLAQQKPSVAQDLSRVPVSTQAARSFDDKVAAVRAAIEEAKRSGKAMPISLSLDETELTSRANEAASQLAGSLLASDLQIHLTRGDMIATSKVTVQGFDLNLGVIASPVVANGQARFVIQEIQTGAIQLPDAVRQEIASQVAQILDPKALGLTFQISSMVIDGGKLLIQGTAQP